jgi:hypothetical protein
VAANHDISHCRQTVFEVNHVNVSLDSRKPRVDSGITFLSCGRLFGGGSRWCNPPTSRIANPNAVSLLRRNKEK